MFIIFGSYLILVWLIFSKFKLLRLTWLSGSLAALICIFIIAIFAALLNSLTPTGRIVVGSRVVEVTPNVSGEVIAVPVKPNVSVKAGTVLFQIDPAPFQYKVRQLEAALVAAQHQADALQANLDQANANVTGLEKQVAFQQQRLADIAKLTKSGSATTFREQETLEQLDIATAQLQAAKAQRQSARAGLDSSINGINTTVIQTRAQLDDVKWELKQTTVKAPSDGYVSTMALAVGARALQARAAMSFIVQSDTTIVGTFLQNGFRTIQPGATVRLFFDAEPGRLYEATILAIPKGVGEGEIAVSGTLARVGSIGGTSAYPAVISIPPDTHPDVLRLGTSGTATVFSETAGVIGLIAHILLWAKSYAAYL
ncbi:MULTISPECIES: biotin/lipoyl-binding protein [unclassified Beijerinckia]|uniref:HlyD family secretion protein n=1 Tax=unclassified Beijerinckia TaxID=2638183 RepID=UPI000897F7BA|nr:MULTISPECIES: biotin/lipoyl-binding protein [unclassified Beijerinckia]MDH7794837.1 multidrug resistance efflux pump [Beijerinckia sp. GAS462]SEB77121.1 Multidrug resistance efflux pump [Beijerinckia sp. 28-YEA-48]